MVGKLTNFASPAKPAEQRYCTTCCWRLEEIARTVLRHSYQGRLSGPFLDRLDLLVEVPVQAPASLASTPAGEPSRVVAARVALARERALGRQGCSNALLAAQRIEALIRAEAPALALLHKAAAQLGWSARGYHRVLRVARTIADLADSEAVGAAHMAEAVQLRRGLGAMSNR